MPPRIAVYRIAVLAVMACLIGAVVSMLALAFVACVAWLNTILLIAPHARVQVQNPALLTAATLLVPALGGLLVGYLLKHHSPEQRPLGPPDSIRAVQLHTPLPSWRGGIVSTLAAALSLGCGASVGQYGPMVYMGTMFGKVVARLQLSIPNIPNLPTIAIACGVAAAISTAFNAPIAGLIFAHEVILRYYSLQAFAPTTVAAAVGYVVANVIFEQPALFLVEFSGVQFGYEFALFALLGVLCAFLATGFMRLLLRSARLARESRIPAPYRPALAGLLVGLVALGLPDVLGVGQEALRFATIEGAFGHWELVLLVTAKLLLTVICIGFGFAGGVFSPSLLIGILFGALFWSVLDIAGLPNSGVVLYAICGMMALTSPVIGAPLTTILITFELTRNYDLTIAAMVAVVFANLLAFRIFGRSLFDVQLAGQGVELSSGRDRAMLENTSVTDCLLDDYTCYRADTCVADALAGLIRDGRAEAVLIDADGNYLGMIRMQDIIHQAPQQPLQELLRHDWPQFDESTSIWQAMRILDNFVGEAIPVLAQDQQKLLGMVTEAALISAYLEIVYDLRREENAAI
ncbi:MAG: chloride channel protein [Thiolinea sp.]